MFYNLRESAKRKWFNYQCKGILTTSAIKTDAPDNIVIFSMICSKDVIMYLIAVKTFYKFLPKGRIVILNDGSLTSADITLLKSHIFNPEIVAIKDVKINDTPTGACWERLLLISDYVKDNYVIQLDADSLVINDMPEINRFLNENLSFALGSGFEVGGKLLGREILPMKEVCEKMRTIKNDYVEVVADSNMHKLPNYEQLKYSRCSACLSGFAKGSFTREDVEDFSRQMKKLLGNRWHEWGTEKITSNYIICNSPGAEILPYPKYTSYYADPAINYKSSAYLHFTGTHRFKNGFYINMAQKAIKDLRQS